MITSSTKLNFLLAFCLAVLVPAALEAGYGNDAFEDDPSLRQKDDLEWPEVEFPSADERGKGFKAGETFSYRARWGIFKKAGSMSFSTENAPNSGGKAITVRTDVASRGLIKKLYPLQMKAIALIDTENWRVVRNQTLEKSGSDHKSNVTLFDFDRMLMNYEDKFRPERNHIRELPYDCPVDYASAFLQIRGFDLEVGTVYPLFITTKGKFYYAQLKVMEMETLKTVLGEKECFRLEPISSYPQSKVFREGGKMALWVTNDQDRIPVQLEVKAPVGTASIRLESYTTEG
ncbi:DUF3108 domain-containing protein [Pelagicoccus mobilis]|uniref:DUF3108 domain-containing protein n=1 Tax=Pelagicoccus mobilis TaxID=415221 RepID=A0A934S0K6_9BACT|nr:DUF3108 domain-containing protein [Pelagicoccus mobilis]MBK1880157.1 DUF3108 domain-containing protein [Pelagicoccus mobilis]